MHVNNDASIGGNVGVNDAGGFLRLSRGVFMADGTIAQADAMDLGDGASVWAVNASTFKSTAGVIRSGLPAGAPALPLTDPFCALPPIDTACTGPDVLVGVGETYGPLAPGSYGRVLVRDGATVALAAGTFTFCDVKIGGNVNVVVNGIGQSVINVVKRFQLTDGTTFGPEPVLAPVPIVNLLGKKLRLGEGASMTAFVSAPHAKLTMGRDSAIGGTFCVDFMKTDKHISLACPCACPCGP